MSSAGAARIQAVHAKPEAGLLAGAASEGVVRGESAKKELNIIKLLTENAAKLDRDTFGVDGAHGPWCVTPPRTLCTQQSRG
jgi:hypothetical protein